MSILDRLRGRGISRPHLIPEIGSDSEPALRFAEADRHAPEPPAHAPSARPAARSRGGLVEIRGVHKSFGDLEVLRGIDLQIAPGSVTAVLGPSGSGKSTLLRTINHLETLDQGLISVDGEVIGYRREGDLLHELPEREVLHQRTAIGMVFQSFNLFAHMTALQNVTEAPRRALGVPARQAEARARELLALVGLSDKADVYPRQLSGGQQQRVAIARALALEPKVLLFDEPTSALDPELVEEVLAVIRSLARAGTTLVIVTHEISFARDVADTVVFMDQGLVVEQGPPSRVIDHPAHERTRSFLQRVRTGTEDPDPRPAPAPASPVRQPVSGAAPERTAPPGDLAGVGSSHPPVIGADQATSRTPLPRHHSEDHS
ncbi:putative ABC transporter ATP-binding protein [Corynebacterium xerosis]|nr:putative ABC transporter ATP-binding protein [Corynebacterium xerosis]